MESCRFPACLRCASLSLELVWGCISQISSRWKYTEQHSRCGDWGSYSLEYRLGLALLHAIKFNIHSPYCFLNFLYKFKYLTKKKKEAFSSKHKFEWNTDSPLLNTSSLKYKCSGKRSRNLGHLVSEACITLWRRHLCFWGLQQVSQCSERPSSRTHSKATQVPSQWGGWKKSVRKRDSRMLKTTAQTSSHYRSELQTQSKSITIKPASFL